MEWKKVTGEATDMLDSLLAGFPAQRKKMFGCPVCFVNGNMFAGAYADSLFFRLSESDRKEIFSEFDGVTPFEPSPGRRMKEYVVLPDSLLVNKEFTDIWLKRSYAYVMSLPPKEPK